MRLEPADMRELISPYLDYGYKQDTVTIRCVEVEGEQARASLDVPAYFPPGDGGYHFTSLHAMLVVSQVGIVLASRANGFRNKPGEIYMRDFSIVCRRRIQKIQDIELRMELRRALRARGQILYEIDYQFEERAFSGRLRCLFPTRAPEPQQ